MTTQRYDELLIAENEINIDQISLSKCLCLLEIKISRILLRKMPSTVQKCKKRVEQTNLFAIIMWLTGASFSFAEL